jgi:hypothetical protein
MIGASGIGLIDTVAKAISCHDIIRLEYRLVGQTGYVSANFVSFLDANILEKKILAFKYNFEHEYCSAFFKALDINPK